MKICEVKQYHGWIVVEDGGTGFKEYVSVEWNEGDVRKRHTEDNWRGSSGCTRAIEWWDKKLGMKVNVETALRGCYRVFTRTVRT